MNILSENLGPVILTDDVEPILSVCQEENILPYVIRRTADGGIAIYFYPDPKVPTTYACFEIFEDGEVVAAWADTNEDHAWDLGNKPSKELIKESLNKFIMKFGKL